MGGTGSGRRYQGGRDTTNEYRALDVRWLNRNGLLTPSRTVSLNWSRNGNPIASIRIRAEAGYVVLTY